MLTLLRGLSLLWPLVLLPAAAARAHPFLDIQPFPPASVPRASTYELVLTLFPGDTPVEQVQLDFELSSLGAFGAPSAVMGSGFALVFDPDADPLHFSIRGDFTGSPLAADGVFAVAQLTFAPGTPGGTLSLLDSSSIVAIELGESVSFGRLEFSNVFNSNVVAQVVPATSPTGLAALGAVLLLGGATIIRRQAPPRG